MKVKELIEFLKGENQELSIELTKIIAVPMSKDKDKPPGEPYILRMDFPIIGVAQREDDLLLIIEAMPEMIAFGKDIKRLRDGKPLTQEDIDAVKARGG